MSSVVFVQLRPANSRDLINGGLTQSGTGLARYHAPRTGRQGPELSSSDGPFEAALSQNNAVQTISPFCFRLCMNLSHFTFERDSKLSNLAPFAFSDCSKLRFISLPSLLERLSPMCFVQCRNLVGIECEAGSRLSAESISALSSEWAVTFK
jgi:hypothetical protein